MTKTKSVADQLAEIKQMDKGLQLAHLTEGDTVKLTNGGVASFVRLKQKNFIGMIDGKSFNIPVSMFVEVVEKVNVELKQEAQKEEYMSLKKDELFFVSRKGEALLFKFDSIKNGKIIGTNPITNSTTRIDPSLFGGKVSDLGGK